MNRRVLVIDEDEEAVKQAVEMLRYHYYDVLTPQSGQEALQMVAASQPWIVITGETLPGAGMDGPDLINAIRPGHWYAAAYLSPGPPGIILLRTPKLKGGEEDQAINQKFAGKVDMYLAKPFHPRELLAFVVRLTNAIEEQREREKNDEKDG